MNDSVKRMKNKLQTGRKYFRITYPIKNEYLKYIKNSQNSKLSNPLRKCIKDMQDIFRKGYTDDVQIST